MAKRPPSRGTRGRSSGGSDGDDLHDHPLGFVAILRGAERFDHLQTLEGFALAGYGTVAVGAVAQFVGEAVEIDAPQEFEDGLGAHLGDELVGVGVFEILVLGGEFVEGVEVFVLVSRSLTANSSERAPGCTTT